MSSVEVLQDFDDDGTTVVSGQSVAGASSIPDGEVEIITVPQQGPPGIPGPPGPAGEDGSGMLYGVGAPTGVIGHDGDFYIDTNAHVIYGPKNFGVWPAGTSIIGPAGPTGAPGPTGPTGSTGSQGPRGNAVLYGTGAPTVGIGIANDFYINTANNFLYGPKAASWPPGTSLIGPPGPQGDPGPSGTTGAQGPQGIPDRRARRDQPGHPARVKIGFSSANPTTVSGAINGDW
jgi:hypothetical protein